MTQVQIRHRADMGRGYRGIPMHAAVGVHDHADLLARRTLPGSARILDVGSGSGALPARLADSGFDVLASDLDIGDYRAGPPVVEWNASATELPASVTPGSFDAICAVEMLEHVENPKQALRNFFAILRPGGVLIASTPHISHPRSRLKFLLRGEPSYFGRAEYYGSGHTMLLPDWLLELHLKETGFVDVSLEYAGQLGLSGKGKLAYEALKPVLSALHLLPEPRVDDGCVTFAIARRPAV